MKTPSGSDEPVFSLTSVYVPQERQNLASFISVDSDAGRRTTARSGSCGCPATRRCPARRRSPTLFASDQDIQDRLLAFTRTNSKALYGNLLTLPVGDGLLYVQPLYTLREAGEGRYPVLRYVLVSFGDDVGIGSTLTAALDDVLGITSGRRPTTSPRTAAPTGPAATGAAVRPSERARPARAGRGASSSRPRRR